VKIIGFDTNVLIALKTKRETSYNQSKILLEDCLKGKIKLFVPIPVILETEWVLRSYYKQPKVKIIEFLDELLEVENVLTESKLEILYALNLYKYSPGLNFTDCVIITQMQSFNIDEFLTFDEKLRKLYDSFTKN